MGTSTPTPEPTDAAVEEPTEEPMEEPTDDAFAALPEGTVETLLEDPEGALTDILLYHVIEGIFPAEDVVQLESITSLLGVEITISICNLK